MFCAYIVYSTKYFRYIVYCLILFCNKVFLVERIFFTCIFQWFVKLLCSSSRHLIIKVEAICSVMAHAKKRDFVFLSNGRVYLNRRGLQFIRLLAAEVCASEVVMLDTPCSEVVWWVLATHSICKFPLHFPSRASPCAITFQLTCTIIDYFNKV